MVARWDRGGEMTASLPGQWTIPSGWAAAGAVRSHLRPGHGQTGLCLDF